MKSLVAVGVMFLAACQEQAPPPVAAAPSPAAKPSAASAKPKPEAPAKPTVKAGKLTVMSMETFFPRQQASTVLIYDARPGFVAGFGKIPGAISWPRHEFDARISQSESEMRAAKAAGKPVVIYCTDAACPDSRAVGEKLAARGHDVAILEGGFAAWKEAGLPTE
ncbi:MAG TPA: rhodanese-like domain-containing protein [Haloferula sp.]